MESQNKQVSSTKIVLSQNVFANFVVVVVVVVAVVVVAVVSSSLSMTATYFFARNCRLCGVGQQEIKA